MRLLQQASSEGHGFGTERHQSAEYHGLKGYAPFDAFMRPKGSRPTEGRRGGAAFRKR